MATSNKVFVSPGVYTSERDLSFVSQSVGITTLGIAGETLKGPAFEPIFITSYGEFETYFGGTTPEKFVNTQIPKYEAAYIAKSYLQQSNQLFVTRILGLSGYDAGPSWTITTVANVDCNTVALTGSPTTFTATWVGTTASTSTVTISGLPAGIVNPTTPYTTYSGGSSTIYSNLQSLIYGAISTPSTSASSIYYFGAVSGNQVTVNIANGYSASTNVFGVDSISTSSINYCSDVNDVWYYATFTPPTNGENYNGYSFYSNIGLMTGNTVTGAYSGTITGNIYNFSGLTYSGYNDLVVATLRSRGITNYSANQHGPDYQVTGTTDVQMVCTGAYSGVTTNPFSTFLVSGITYENSTFQFETSFQSSNANYISKVFGVENFAKDRTEVPLFVEERYPTLLNYGYNKGFIRGLNCSLISLPEARNNDIS